MITLARIAAAFFVTAIMAFPASSQKLMGLVIQKNAEGGDEPVVGANVHWLGTTTAVTTGTNGIFTIPYVTGADRVVVSFVGMIADTITITNQTNIKVLLESVTELKEVTVEGWRPSSELDHTRGVNTLIMLEKELFKAACCNLSESFETNPAVDVAFTDAITGTRQIQMLGLAGPNTMISIENMPGVRGLGSSQGIQLIPGTWINSIEVTKGVGPVVNGYESIAGQINVELKKPQESDKLYVNGYLNQSGRSEVNLNYSAMAGKKWATTFLVHGSTRPFEMDENHDTFLDFPVGHQLNVINRWVFSSGTGWLGQIGVNVLRDTKRGGQKNYDPESDRYTTNRYGFEIDTRRTTLWGKLGYQFEGKPYKSAGLQLSAIDHDHNSYYGFNEHVAREKTLYANLIYQSIIGSTNHKFKTGLSYLADQFDERLRNDQNPMMVHKGLTEMYLVNTMDFSRKESVPGAFAEYTYEYLDKISVIAGVRVDRHNLFGTFFTPRVHTRFSLSPMTTLRLSAGKGTRVANVLVENPGILASSRRLMFSGFQSDHAYGFNPDVAWNYGMNFAQEFKLDYRPGTVSLDYFFTDFKNQVVVDQDASSREAHLYGLSGKSFSHSLQLQLDYQLMRRLDLRVAYRWLDVRTDMMTGLLQRPLIAKHRSFVNLAYETRNKWKFDYTVNWIGEQRIPNTMMSPSAYQLPGFSDPYWLMNAQVTKDLGQRWSFYVGMENITDFKLNNPIVSANDPFGQYFDSSLVWGPVFGRLTYFGFRYRVK